MSPGGMNEPGKASGVQRGANREPGPAQWAQRARARCYLLALEKLDLLGQLVEVERLLREGVADIGHVVVHRGQLGRRVCVEQLRELVLPGIAVGGERLLEGLAVNPDEADVGDALLCLDVLLQLLVTRDVRLESRQRAVRLRVDAAVSKRSGAVAGGAGCPLVGGG